ncbi:MAG: lysophospholipid acyltransferase family protein [Proteobacteria bacterium]|nr:lysophospholipid acyltransferase family protein [Pseudomonadota bacterium]MBU1710589.1 lysophospholipid acyltransferase family protein [Pseudomonadota bacterium]
MFIWLTRILFATCRVDYKGFNNLEECEKGSRPFIAVFWHYSVFFVMHFCRGRSWVAMVSASKDGEYVSHLLNKLGNETVRGSRGKGGLKALREMAAHMQEGKNAAIVADGSKGPALVVQAGMILLASRTGAPILPFICAVDRYWAFTSWDRTILPKPFANIIFTCGEAMQVPPDIRSKDIEVYRLELETRLNALYLEAWSEFGKEHH